MSLWLEHSEENCGLVMNRVVCEKCGYPASEARFLSLEEWLEYDADMAAASDFYEDALGG